jgi:hypothetical protein
MDNVIEHVAIGGAGIVPEISKICVIPGCGKKSSWALKFRQPIYCSTHGPKNGATSQTKICICGSKTPTYGFKDDPIPSCCKRCKQDGMIEKSNKKCLDCDKAASYGIKGSKKKEYCADHRKVGMVDLKNKTCIEKDCTVLASFGTELKNPLYCYEHKKTEMKNVEKEKCEDCDTKASFGLVKHKPTHCSLHKKLNMINVVSRLCAFEGCKVRPTFGTEKGHATHCVEHKEIKMIDVRRYTFCYEKDCPTIPTFGYTGESPTSCKKHKKEDMVYLIINDLCPGAEGLKGPDNMCPLSKFGTSKYDGYCVECFIRAFPDDERTKTARKNSKELKVRDYLAEALPDLTFIHDSPIWTHGCDCTHRRRIDLRVMIEDTLLCVEIDEDQHKFRNMKDEDERYDDLFMVHSGKYVFIRYNPDSYKTPSGGKSKTSDETRLKYLKTFIEKQIERIQKELNKDLIEVHKLFYDGFKM